MVRSLSFRGRSLMDRFGYKLFSCPVWTPKNQSNKFKALAYWEVGKLVMDETSEETSAQTSVIEAVDKDIQSIHFQESEVQTESDEIGTAANTTYDEGKLASFLERVCPSVIKELDRISCSNAFASYAVADDSDSEVKEILTLPPQGVEGVKVSGLSWSCTGSVLAVAVSHTLHTGWCCHPGHVTLYNVDRVTKRPSCTLEVPSCVRSVSMHPYLSSVVAVGTFSGEVLVWDISHEKSDSSLVNVSHTTHNDSVTQIRWIVGTATSVLLVSSSLDGHVIFWKVSPKLSSYEALNRFSFDLSTVSPGVTCFAFPNHKQDPFVVALEGGALLHCSSAAAKPMASVTPGESLNNPVVSAFEGQTSTVTCVEFSPHQDDIFATASIDQAIRIYSFLQGSVPLRVVCISGPVLGVCWSPSQANVLAAYGHSSCVTLCNTQTGDVTMAFVPYNTEYKDHLCYAVYNVKSPRLLAVGDLNGVAHIWECPTKVKPT